MIVVKIRVLCVNNYMVNIMINSQTDYEIKKVKNQLIECHKKEKEYSSKISECEEKLSKLKKSLDRTADNFSVFDKLNNSFRNTTELRCVTTWIESRANKNYAEKRNASFDMDSSYNEQKRENELYRQKLDNCYALETRLRKKLKLLEEQKKKEVVSL